MTAAVIEPASIIDVEVFPQRIIGVGITRLSGPWRLHLA